MPHCLMLNCSNKSGKAGKRLTQDELRFSHVPSVIRHQGELQEQISDERRRRWNSAINRADITEEKLNRDRVCHRHFVSGKAAQPWDQFNVDWVPTLNLGYVQSEGKKNKAALGAARAKRRAQRQKCGSDAPHNPQPKRRKVVVNPRDENSSATEPAGPSIDGGQEDAEELNNATQKGQENEDNLSKATQTEQDVQDAHTQTVESSIPVDAETQTSELEYLFQPSKLQPFTEQYFCDSKSEAKVRFYTGLSGLDVLKQVLDFVAPYVTRRTKNLTQFQELVLVLMKLRLNVPLQDLAYRFEISLSTVSRILTAWMTVLDVRLSPLIRWPERDELWLTMPMCFRFAFGKKTTIIIDCFEVFIERPSNLLARAQTFSNYKHHNTVKFLIGITPQGSVCFVSNAWGGRTSDKHLTDHCGILKNLKPGDLVMADRGFTIQDSLSVYQAQLAIPAFT